MNLIYISLWTSFEKKDTHVTSSQTMQSVQVVFSNWVFLWRDPDADNFPRKSEQGDFE